MYGGCHSLPADAIFCLVLGKKLWGLLLTAAEIFFVSQGFNFSAAHSPVPKNGGIQSGGGGVLGLYVEEENKNSIIGADLPFLHFIT